MLTDSQIFLDTQTNSLVMTWYVYIFLSYTMVESELPNSSNALVPNGKLIIQGVPNFRYIISVIDLAHLYKSMES